MINVDNIFILVISAQELQYNTIKGLTCTFRASCYSACLSWALVLTWVSSFVQDKKLGFGLGGEKVISLRHSR